jgi:hypothetical protein
MISAGLLFPFLGGTKDLRQDLIPITLGGLVVISCGSKV